MGAQCAGQKKRSESLSQEGHQSLLCHTNNATIAEVKEHLKHQKTSSYPIIVRSLKVKCSTFFTLKGLEYYAKSIEDMQKQPNVQLHFVLKITSYFEDDDSYSNISHLLLSAKDSYQLTLDFQNSLIRKKRIFQIIKERLPQFENLQSFTFKFGFCYVPNVTGKILFDILPRCKKLTSIYLDFQMDVFIKARTLQPHDKPSLPNDKIACDIGSALRQCKHLKNVSLNLSQMLKADQNYEKFFKQLSQCSQVERLELVLRNCKLDNQNLLMIGSMLAKNQQLKKLDLVLDNNSFDNIQQMLSEIVISSSQKQHHLLELSLLCSSIKVSSNDLAEFVQNLSCFPNLASFSLNIAANNYDKFILTQLLQQFVHNILKIAFGKETFAPQEEQKYAAILNFWKKCRKTVLCSKL